MKSVIAQGSSVVKAIEEALKKAGMPTEFFVKLLENAQGGFLGFGAKKAKIALFFKQHTYQSQKDGVLNQHVYEDLFDNNSINKQIEQQLKGIELPKVGSHAPHPKQNQSKQHQPNRPNRPMHQRELPNNTKNIPSKDQNSKPTHNPIKQDNKQNIDKNRSTTFGNQQPSNQNFTQKKRSMDQRPLNQPKQNTSTDKPLIRPLPPKNNDSSKS